MAGLMTQMPGSMPGAMPGSAPEAAKAAPAGAPGAEPNVTPEEQAQYDNFMDNAKRLIYDEKSSTSILNRLRLGAKPENGIPADPIEALANVAFTVVSTLDKKAAEAGAPVSEDVIYHGGAEVVEDVANYAKEAKIHDYTDKEIEGAFYKTLELYGEDKKRSGGIDPKQAQADLGELMQMDKAGTLQQALGMGGNAG